MGFEKLSLLRAGPTERVVAGVDCSGSKEIPNETWLAVGTLEGASLEISKLQKVGMHLLKAELQAVAPSGAGLDFPFSLPAEFLAFMSDTLERPPFQAWQEVAEQLVFMPFEQFSELAQSFRKEPKRFTDEKSCAPASSPLHRVNPSMIHMTYHGIRMLASLDPEKFYILPFQDPLETGCAVLEVYPRAILRCLGLPDTGYKSKDKKDKDRMHSIRHKMLQSLLEAKIANSLAKEFPTLVLPKKFEHVIVDSDHALDALLACYGTAAWLATPDLFVDPFASDNLDVLLEGWIYEPRGLLQPTAR